MISSVDNFSNVAPFLSGVNQPYESSHLPHNKEEESSIQKNKQSEDSKDSSSSKYSADSLSSNKEELSEEDLKKIQELKNRDAEVRTHEQAHQSAAGSLSNGATSFDYETGPDGKRYAVGGEVSINVSKVSGDPQATIEKARQIRRAALAPADPSGQDRQVAAQAAAMEIEANKELSSQKQDEESATSIASETGFYNQIQSLTSSNKNGAMLDYFA